MSLTHFQNKYHLQEPHAWYGLNDLQMAMVRPVKLILTLLIIDYLQLNPIISAIWEFMKSQGAHWQTVVVQDSTCSYSYIGVTFEIV